MPVQSSTPNNIVTFNKHGLHLQWPRRYIIILGILLIFLCFCIAGMEVGHTVVDVYRSTAFGGFILFIPLLICAIFVLVTAFKPRLTLLRIAVILCCIMIILCLVLIAYDILVIMDPTRCFFLDCNYAVVNATNSTTTVIVTGWPIYITWPYYFLINMNAKKIFQSIQILCACLFILFSALYILTYVIYRRINLHQKSVYNADTRTLVTHEAPASPIKQRPNNTVQSSHPAYSLNHLITTFTIEGHSASSGPIVVQTPGKEKKKIDVRPQTSTVNYDRICTRCLKEPRMFLTSNYERQNHFSHLCENCNNELSDDRRKPAGIYSEESRLWKP